VQSSDDPILASYSTSPTMLVTVGISIHLFNTTYTVYLKLDINLGLDEYEYGIEEDEHDLHLKYSFDLSEDSEDSG
jgi:hypothetical protein